MKTRNGFVSNSSSSSFIVAFPKMPKSDKDVLKYMFNGEEGGVGLDYYDKGLSYAQVAKIVFDDIDNGNVKKGNIKVLIDAMIGRYYYVSNRRNVRWLGSNNDEHGGSWSYDRSRYCGSDKKLMEDLRMATINEEDEREILREKEAKLVEKSGIKDVPYAFKGGNDPYTKKPYTNAQIKSYEDYKKELGAFHDTDIWINFQKEQRASWNKWHTIINDIREKLAEADAKNFLDDNKGKYIFVASYADEDSWQGGTMEHGNIFRNVPHIKISNH